MPSSEHPILINATLHTRSDLFHALAGLLPSHARRSPTNLDAMADILKELHATKIVCSDWRMGTEETARITRIFDDLGIRLVR